MLTEASVNLLQSYQSGLSSYDEVLDLNGKIKPYWQALFSTLEKLGLDELKNRNQEIISKLRENGVTYNVYGTPDGLNRPWQLDPIPFLIEQKEWALISKGLAAKGDIARSDPERPLWSEESGKRRNYPCRTCL